MPRISPDGKWLVVTVADYGCFPIWHHEADLCIINLQTKECQPLSAANSRDTESYHSWSSNGRWLVFGSRRVNGLYTMPYICHIDKNGKASKPFLLPQKSPDFYDKCLKSFNIPEFVKDKVELKDIEKNNFSRFCYHRYHHLKYRELQRVILLVSGTSTIP